LNVVRLHCPPLRERPGYIAPLALHFAARLAQRLGRPLSLADTAVAWLEAQPWRGNVRELEHAIERAAVLTDKEVLEPEDLRKGPLPTPPVVADEGGGGVGGGSLGAGVGGGGGRPASAAPEPKGRNGRAQHHP